MRLRLQIVLVALVCLLTVGMVATAPLPAKVYTAIDPAAAEVRKAAVFRAEQAEDAPYKAARARAIERGALLEAQVREGIAHRAAEKARAARKAAPPRAVTESAPAEAEIPVPSGSVEDAIATYFGDVYAKAYRVAFCESRHIPTAISPGGDWGLFQVNVVHKQRVANMGYSWNQLLDPYVNAHVARSIYDEQGWGPWSCRGA